jgi:hypothetical protein
VVFQSRFLFHLQNCYLLCCRLNRYLYLRPSYRYRLRLQNCYLSYLRYCSRSSTMMSCYSMISTISVHTQNQVLGGILGYLRWMMTMNCYSKT